MGDNWGHDDCTVCNEARNSERELLIKYICHVAVAEGESFALDVNLSPADMVELGFTNEEKRVLEEEIFPEVRRRLER